MCGNQNSSHDNNSLNDADICNSVSVVNERFQHAFGALLLHSEGDCYDNSWCMLCCSWLLVSRITIVTCLVVHLAEHLLFYHILILIYLLRGLILSERIRCW